MHLAVTDIEYIPFAVAVLLVETVLRPDLGGFAVQMHHMRASSPFMKVVHVLGDHIHYIILLQFGNQAVGFIGTDFRKLAPLHVVEIQNLPAVPIPSFDGSHFHRVIAVPQSAVVPVCAKAAFGADSRAGEHCNAFFHFIPKYLSFIQYSKRGSMIQASPFSSKLMISLRQRASLSLRTLADEFRP